MAHRHCVIDGHGDPVVLLHGGGLDSRMFEHDAVAIASFARVVRYDRSGSGRSPATTGPVDRVAELHDVLTAAAGTTPVVLVGSSFGGQLAIDFALAQPSRVAGLVLLGPGLSGVDPSPDLQARVARLADAAREGGDALADAWFADPRLAPHGLPPAIAALVRSMLRDNARLFNAPSTSRPSPPATGRLRDLKTPGVVIIGERDDDHHHAIALKLAADAQALEYERLPGAGHYPTLERPRWLATVVRTLSERLKTATH